MVTSGHVGSLGPLAVQLVRWPAEEERRRLLTEGGHPRLLLVPAGAPVPDLLDEREDWVRVPVDERDLWTRIRRLDLQARGAEAHLRVEDHVARRGAVLVVLPPTGAAVLSVLAEQRDRLVSRDTLTARTGVQARALDSTVHRLRREVGPLGVTIHTIRARGFLLAEDELPTTDVATGGPVRAGPG